MTAMGRDNTGDLALRLYLEKHGAYYHPVRVVAAGKDTAAVFVLNGAVSGRGRRLMRREVPLLDTLASRFNGPVIPAVYASGDISGPGGDAGFFLGQWFEGFHEFHATGSGDAVAVWRPGRADLILPLGEALPVYGNIARVLVLAYDLGTGSEIYPWHHAAGDFIVDPSSPELPVRLVTVRGYGGLSDMDMGSTGPYPALLFFLLNLTLRMRLDRTDGVGKPVFLDKSVLDASLKGAFTGLKEKDLPGPDFLSGFLGFLSGFGEEQLLEILVHMLDTWPPGASETEIIQANLAGHCREIKALFNSRDRLDFY